MVLYSVAKNIIFEPFIWDFLVIGKVKIGDKGRILCNVVDKIHPFFVDVGLQTHEVVHNQLNKSFLFRSTHCY